MGLFPLGSGFEPYDYIIVVFGCTISPPILQKKKKEGTDRITYIRIYSLSTFLIFVWFNSY